MELLYQKSELQTLHVQICLYDIVLHYSCLLSDTVSSRYMCNVAIGHRVCGRLGY